MSSARPIPLDWDGHPADEPVIASFVLENDLWMKYRCCTCTGQFMAALSGTGLCCLFALPYSCCAGSCRKMEAASFSLYLTPTALHYKMKQYACGCCCQNTTTKSIPLDKIQDIELISDCCGDSCGFVHEPGRPYKLNVQTAGFSGPQQGAELTVFCVADPEGLRAKVLAAKRDLMALGSTGAGKDVPSSPAPGTGTLNPLGAAGGMTPAATERVVAVLERIERALNDGLAEMRVRSGSASGAGVGASKY